MRLILDANEYILGLDETSGEGDSIRLIHEVLPRLIEEAEDLALLVPDIVRDEVQRNVPRRILNRFYRLVTSDPKILYGWLYELPPELLDKYAAKGLKPADATIAAFADWFKADFLISDNRHIYEQLKVDEFVTCTAAEFVRLVDSGEVWKGASTNREPGHSDHAQTSDEGADGDEYVAAESAAESKGKAEDFT